LILDGQLKAQKESQEDPLKGGKTPTFSDTMGDNSQE
jgi:hypothetical protein